MYEYQKERENIFTDEGQRLFLKIRDRVAHLLDVSEAFTMGAAIRTMTGDSWTMLACVDRLVELKEIEEVEQTRMHAGQDRIFIRKR